MDSFDTQRGYQFVSKDLKTIIEQQDQIYDHQYKKVSRENTKGKAKFKEEDLDVLLSKSLIDSKQGANKVFNEAFQISQSQFLITQAYQNQKSLQLTFNIVKNDLIKHHQSQEIIFNQLVTVESLTSIIVKDNIGALIGTNQGQIIRVIDESQYDVYLSGSKVTCIKKMNSQVQSIQVNYLTLVGFEDHQINIFDYETFQNLYVFKEGFSIPIPQKQVLANYLNDYIIGASEDGTLTFWLIGRQIVETLKLCKRQNKSIFLNISFPKFEVVPQSKIASVHTSPLMFIELYGIIICIMYLKGELIVSYEESGKLRIWFMEHQFKQFLTIWVLEIKEQITTFSVCQEYHMIFMSSTQNLFLIEIPTIENGEFHCQVSKNVDQAESNQFNHNQQILSWIRYTDQKVMSGIKFINKGKNQTQEIDY